MSRDGSRQFDAPHPDAHDGDGSGPDSSDDAAASDRLLDTDSLERWHEEYGHRVRAFVWGICRDSSRVEEVVQTVFLKAATHGGHVRSGSERAWLFQVAYREAKLLQRRARTESGVIEKQSKSLRLPSESPEQRLLSDEAIEQVRLAFHQLPDEQQQVVQLRMTEELTFQQIADRLQLPLGTVLTRMRLALQRLRLSLEHYHNNNDPAQ